MFSVGAATQFWWFSEREESSGNDYNWKDKTGHQGWYRVCEQQNRLDFYSAIFTVHELFSKSQDANKSSRRPIKDNFVDIGLFSPCMRSIVRFRDKNTQLLFLWPNREDFWFFNKFSMFSDVVTVDHRCHWQQSQIYCWHHWHRW